MEWVKVLTIVAVNIALAIIFIKLSAKEGREFRKSIRHSK